MLSGLLALVGVAAAVGVILGFGALMASKMLGLSGSEASSTSAAQESMYLPKPSITADAQSGPTRPKGSRKPSAEASESEDTGIVLAAAQTNVSPMGHIDLSGTYPGGDGAILTVQRLEAGSWEDFPVSTSVSAGAFSTYIQTGQPGVNRFRVFDSGNGTASNEIAVTVG